MSRGLAEPSREACVLVVGAGLAGLCAAVTLAEAGRSCLLLEREDQTDRWG